MKTVSIQTRTMDFVGGIVPVGARYYEAIIRGVDNPHKIHYKRAMDIPLELMIEDYGLNHVSWTNKHRDFTPEYKGSKTQLSRRATAWLDNN